MYQARFLPLVYSNAHQKSTIRLTKNKPTAKQPLLKNRAAVLVNTDIDFESKFP